MFSLELHSAEYMRMPRPPGYAGLANYPTINKTQVLITGMYNLIIMVSGWSEKKSVYPRVILLVMHAVYK